MMHYVAVRQWERAGISGPRPLAPEKVHDPVVFCAVRSPFQHLWIRGTGRGNTVKPTGSTLL